MKRLEQKFDSYYNEKKGFGASFPLEKVVSLLNYLQNPEKNQKIVNVAGTSGKGSTVLLISKILESQNKNIGSSFSPHTIDRRERIQINSEMISELEFDNLFDRLLPIVKEAQKTGQSISYFAIILVIALIYFKSKKVDYSVLEVGLGGRLDATNFASNKDKLCVLNSIGLDHIHILGNTLELIAAEKAGIIQEGNQVIALTQDPEVNQVFQTIASSKNATIDWVTQGEDFGNIQLEIIKSRPGVLFQYRSKDRQVHDLRLSLPGEYQAYNCALALRAVELLAIRDGWRIQWKEVKKCLQKISFAGRFDVIQGSDRLNTTIIDGAHNPQKMHSFLASLVQYYPDAKFNLLVAIKKNKDSHAILDEILKLENRIESLTLTSFGYGQETGASENPAVLVDYLQSKKFNNFDVESDLCGALEILKSKQVEKSINVITGSLYLVEKVYQEITK